MREVITFNNLFTSQTKVLRRNGNTRRHWRLFLPPTPVNVHVCLCFLMWGPGPTQLMDILMMSYRLCMAVAAAAPMHEGSGQTWTPTEDNDKRNSPIKLIQSSDVSRPPSWLQWTSLSLFFFRPRWEIYGIQNGKHVARHLTCHGRSQSNGITAAPSHAPVSVETGSNCTHSKL